MKAGLNSNTLVGVIKVAILIKVVKKEDSRKEPNKPNFSEAQNSKL